MLDKGLGRYDPAVRAWARTDRKVAAAVAQVDRRRVKALTALFEAAASPPPEPLRARGCSTPSCSASPRCARPRREAGELKRMIDVFT